MLPALLVSVAVHVAAGGLLFSGWRWAAVDLPQPMTVTLEALPPVAVEALPPRAEHRAPKKLASSEPPAPPPRLQHPPIEVPIAVDRVDPSFAALLAARTFESAPARTRAARAPAGNAAGADEAIEPPQFNVAYLDNPRPTYPPVARRLGLEGRVVLRVQVSAKGAPEEVVIAQSSGAAVLDEAALKAVQGWTFVPARRGETPIARAVDVPILFRLQN